MFSDMACVSEQNDDLCSKEKLFGDDGDDCDHTGFWRMALTSDMTQQSAGSSTRPFNQQVFIRQQVAIASFAWQIENGSGYLV